MGIKGIKKQFIQKWKFSNNLFTIKQFIKLTDVSLIHLFIHSFFLHLV